MSELAPLHGDDSSSSMCSYIVVFKDNCSSDEKKAEAMGQVRQIFTSAGEGNKIDREFSIGKFQAFSATMNKDVRDKVRALPSVKYVEVDQVVSIPPGEMN